jgi:hypothetical protein
MGLLPDRQEVLSMCEEWWMWLEEGEETPTGPRG